MRLIRPTTKRLSLTLRYATLCACEPEAHAAILCG